MRSWSSRFLRWTGSRALLGEQALTGWIVSTGFGSVSRSTCTLAQLGTCRLGAKMRGRTLFWEKLSTEVLGCFGMRPVDGMRPTLIDIKEEGRKELSSMSASHSCARLSQNQCHCSSYTMHRLRFPVTSLK